LTTIENLEISTEIRSLYRYLVDKGCIEQLDKVNTGHLNTFSREVLRQIQTGDPGWTEHVPPEVAEVIQRRRFFGYQGPQYAGKAAPVVQSDDQPALSSSPTSIG